MRTVKGVAVGSYGVGKTSMLVSYTTNAFPGYGGCVFDNFAANIILDGKIPVQFALWDTAGQIVYDRLRPLSYPDTDVFFLCFAVDCPQSFEELETRFIPEIDYHCPGVPFIVVGTKSDLREEKNDIMNNKIFVQKENAQLLADDYNAGCYFECSALTQDNLKQVFDAAVREGLRLKNMTNTQKNREMFRKYKIYHLNSFKFCVLTCLMDILLTVIYVLTIIVQENDNKLLTYHLYCTVIVIPIVLVVIIEYILVYWRSMSTTFMFCALPLVIFILIPFITFISSFSMISYLFYHFVHIKFPMKYKLDAMGYINLFTLIEEKYKSKNKTDYLLCLTIINYQLSKHGITKKIDKLEEYVLSQNNNEYENFIDTIETGENKQFGLKTLENFVKDNEINMTSSFIKYLFFNVYNTLLKCDYIVYHDHRDGNDIYCKLWWKQNISLFLVGFIFHCVLCPFYVIVQFSRIIICFIYYEYFLVLNIILMVALFVLILLFWMYILPFYCNIWKIGYNQKLNHNVNLGVVVRDVNKSYKYHNTIKTKLLLKSLFGTDITFIICQYVFRVFET